MSLDAVFMRILDRLSQLEGAVGRLRLAEGASPYVAQAAAAYTNPFVNPGFSVWNTATTLVSPGNGTTPVSEIWGWEQNNDGLVTVSQTTAPNYPLGGGGVGQYALFVDVTTADASLAAGQYAAIVHPIEGWRAAPFLGRVFTLGFWVAATKTGTYCVFFRNSGLDRSYIAEYTINVADTWEYKTVTVAASPSAGTWNYTNGYGLRMGWTLGNGSSYQTPAGAWAAGNFISSANQVNALDSATNYFWLYGATIAAGSSVPPFMARPFDMELALTQRYYHKTFNYGQAPVQNSGTIAGALSYRVMNAGTVFHGVMWPFPTRMRTTPTVTFYNPSAANTNWRNISTGVDSGASTIQSNGDMSIIADSAGAAGDGLGQLVSVHATADARL